MSHCVKTSDITERRKEIIRNITEILTDYSCTLEGLTQRLEKKSINATKEEIESCTHSMKDIYSLKPQSKCVIVEKQYFRKPTFLSFKLLTSGTFLAYREFKNYYSLNGSMVTGEWIKEPEINYDKINNSPSYTEMKLLGIGDRNKILFTGTYGRNVYERTWKDGNYKDKYVGYLA